MVLNCLVCVCLFVCLSVTTLVATSLVSMLKIRCVGGYLRFFLVFNSWSFEHFSVQNLWHEKSNMLMSITLYFS